MYIEDSYGIITASVVGDLWQSIGLTQSMAATEMHFEAQGCENMAPSDAPENPAVLMRWKSATMGSCQNIQQSSSFSVILWVYGLWRRYLSIYREPR